MTAALLVVLITVLVAAIAVGHLEWHAWSHRMSVAMDELGLEVSEASAQPAGWLGQVTARRVTVHTTDERSIEGLLTVVADDGLVLRAARFLDAGVEIDMAGEVFVDRAKILMVQVVTDLSHLPLRTDVAGGRQ